MGESETLHCPLMIGDGIATNSILNVPNQDDAPAVVTVVSCRHQDLENKEDEKYNLLYSISVVPKLFSLKNKNF